MPSPVIEVFEDHGNFQKIVEYTQGIASEMEKFASHPALDEGNAILAAVANLTREMQERFDALDRKIDNVSVRVDNVSVRIDNLSARNDIQQYNATTRMFNFAARFSQSPLYPLKDLRTGQLIAGFPATLDAFDALTTPTVNRMLRSLGLDLGGDANARKLRLKADIGLGQ